MKRRKAILFIAMSLDGCIADERGKVDWLAGQDANAAEPDFYTDFIREADTVLMGWNTYRQIVTELSPDEWPYAGLMSYVVTHRAPPARQGVRFTDEPPCELVARLMQQPGRNLWICGGASVVRPLMAAGLIDEYRITVIPTLLGAGIRLFESPFDPTPLRLTRVREGNGMVELVYERR